MHIPVLNFHKFNISVTGHSVSPNDKDLLAKEVINKFEKVGFCYITNHGIPDEFIQQYIGVCRRFFEQPVSNKKLYERQCKQGYHGWIGIGEECLDSKRPGDMKETFNFHPGQSPDTWPQVIPEFQSMNQKMFQYSQELGTRLCELLAIGLDLYPQYFNDRHRSVGSINNGTALRSLYYPPLGSNPDLKPGQIRLGEHSDYGTITILFQDDVGGLEVKTSDQGFIPATPVPGTVLVNIGDMLQMWTSDRLVATKHRVQIPESETARIRSRQSVAFFILPDDDVIIRCIDGSDKYQPITAVNYLNFKISQAYKD